VSLVIAKKFVKSQLPLNPPKPQQQQQNATYFVARIPVYEKPTWSWFCDFTWVVNNAKAMVKVNGDVRHHISDDKSANHQFHVSLLTYGRVSKQRLYVSKP